MSDLFESEFTDPILDRIYMFPNVMTDDASDLAEAYYALSKSGLEQEDILNKLVDQYPFEAEDLKAWLLEDQ